MADVLDWLCVGLTLGMAAGTLLNLHPSPHWFIRGWDFPRLQIAALCLIGAVPYLAFSATGRWYDWAFAAVAAATVAWQAWKVLPYTPLWRVEVKRAERPTRDRTLRIVMSNVEMGNREYDRWRRVIAAEDADIILAIEIDEAWLAALAPFRERYPHVVAQPQDNCYGMALLSRLPLHDPRVEFVVQDDVPSIHVDVQLPGGQRVHLVIVHPRPPEPLRAQDAKPRDAELIVIGQALDDMDPCIIAGDLNDVAWSDTTKLFRRISGLLDPRRGRGMFNSWNANNPLFRFPLDHVFHSNQFRLVELRRLEHVGSDHFPVLVVLSYEPDAAAEQPEPEPTETDEEDAQEKIEEQEAEAGRPIRDG